MKREERQPESIPNAIGIAKLLSEVRPNSSDTTIIIIIAIRVVTEVTMVLILTLLRLSLTSSSVEALGIIDLFSRIRS